MCATLSVVEWLDEANRITIAWPAFIAQGYYFQILTLFAYRRAHLHTIHLGVSSPVALDAVYRRVTLSCHVVVNWNRGKLAETRRCSHWLVHFQNHQPSQTEIAYVWRQHNASSKCMFSSIPESEGQRRFAPLACLHLLYTRKLKLQWMQVHSCSGTSFIKFYAMAVGEFCWGEQVA